MATEQQSKSPNGHNDQLQQPHPQPPPPQHALTPAIAYPPHQFGGHFPPPPGYPGPFYTYAPMPDGSHDPNAPTGMPAGPYLVAYPPPPPGMVYAFSPPGIPGYSPFPQGIPPNNARPKRKQVKMACTNCAGACKRCDETRPCERCKKYGIADSCVDGVRKERKKGVKRGPYKRKSKASADAATGATSNGESTESPAVSQAVYVPTEYSYPAPYYIPQPYAYPPPPHPDGHSSPHGGEEGHSNGNGLPQTIPHPMFPLHPAVYPTYPPYPYAQAPPPAVMQAPPAPAAPAQQDKASETADETSKGKKRGRPSKADDSAAAKEKRAKATSSSAEDSSTETSGVQYTE